MPWSNVTWDVPLGEPPRVAAIGRNAHGFVPSDRYRLPDLWSLHVYGYEADCRIDDIAFPIHPGFVGLTPPGATLETRYRGISVHLYVHFECFGDPRPVRAMQDLGEDYDAFYRRIHALSTVFSREPRRVSAGLWNVLWDLAERPEIAPGPNRHPAVGHAVDIIERRLAEPISVADVAEEAGVSVGYLSRLFRDSFDTTVVGYIRDRRVDRATHLLQRSTLPIKTIAASVGLGDLQYFNKTIRARHGKGPRELRRVLFSR